MTPLGPVTDDRPELPAHLRDLDHLPRVLGPAEIAALWGISAREFYRRKNRGIFDFLKLHQETGPRCYSGVLVGRYLKGEPVYVPSFGRKRRA